MRVLDKKKMAPILVLMMLSAVTAGAVVWVSISFTAGGTFTARDELKLYSNAACTVPLETIDWGPLHRGDVKTLSVWIKNTGEREARISWTYTMTGGTGTTWTLMYASLLIPKDGYIDFIQPGANKEVTLTLTCSSTEVFGNSLNISTTFKANDI